MVISRIIIRVAPFRALITLLITNLLSPLPLQVRESRKSCFNPNLQAEPLKPEAFIPSARSPGVEGFGFLEAEREGLGFRVEGFGFLEAEREPRIATRRAQ